MKTAIISFTENGRKLSEKTADSFPGFSVIRYCFHRHCDENAVAFTSLEALTGEIFKQMDALIFVCACGIAVRAISPYIGRKDTDPAVIAMDEGGRFVIPLLSGHIGGANRLSELLAEKTGAVPVITTATDIGRRFSPDSFARANHLLLSDMDAAKKIASAVLENETIGIYSMYTLHNPAKELSEVEQCKYGIVIADKEIPCAFETPLYLIPKNLVIGIGCKRGTSGCSIEAFVEKSLAEADIRFDRVNAVSTIDIKKDEPGLREFCEKYHLPLLTFSAKQLMEAKGTFTPSAFVTEVTGADNVCERSAVLASGGEVILRKQCGNGVTCAVAESPVVIDFERKLL